MIYKRSLLILLTLLLICPLTVLGDELEEEYERTREIGELIGYYDGLYYDYFPTYSEVLNKYNAYSGNKSTKHRDYFVEGYYEGFRQSYQESMNKKEAERLKLNSSEYGNLLGLLLGEIYGNMDYYKGDKYNPRSAIPSNNDIVKKFSLDRLNNQERNSFVTSFKEAFEVAYIEEYLRLMFSSLESFYEEGLAHGEYFGSLRGEADGVRDFLHGLSKNYTRNMPTDREIVNTYSLNRDEQEYKEAFLAGFKKAYEESYNASFTRIKTDANTKSYQQGYDNGMEYGKDQGKSYAILDFYKGLDNNWKRHYPSSSDLFRQYNLLLQDAGYRDGFKNGFILGLYEGYTEEYERQYSQFYVNSTSTELIPISGGLLNTLDSSLSIKVDEGTYYNPVVIRVDTLSYNDYDSKDLIRASNLYKISLNNSSNVCNDEKYIELSFEYYGEDNGGIYKLVEGKWLYLSSKVEEGTIKASIKPNSIRDEGSIYGVFVDKNYRLLYDIRSHWAKEEIITYQKRNIVNGYSDRSFRPDKEITRGEFLTILSRVYNWPVSSWEDIMAYGLEKGYVEGLKDKDIKAPVSYREAELIMRRVLNSENFHWYNVAAKMLYEKEYKCKSYYSMDKNMTRAEAIYMLYIMNEWRY